MRYIAALLCLVASTSFADPERYLLDKANSQVGFSYMFEGAERQGEMPVKSAVMMIDLDNVPASRVTVELDASKARAGFVFATQVMRGGDVLDTGNHPTIRFVSTSVKGDLRGARVTGNLTVRGVTRPVTLEAGLFRQRGTEVDNRDNLTILLTGSIDRNAFGASGFPGYVGPQIGLRIVAQINR